MAVAAAVGIIALAKKTIDSKERGTAESRDGTGGDRIGERPAAVKQESILQKKIGAEGMAFKTFLEKMDYIEEMIGDDEYPENAAAAMGKLDSDLDFLLSLDYSYERTSCILKVSRNYVRDSMKSGKDPMDFLSRLSLYDQTLRKFGDKVDYEELMQNLSNESKDAILHLEKHSSDDYASQLTGISSEDGELGEIASRIAGGIKADRIENDPSTMVAALSEIKDSSLRLGTEKSLLRSDTLDPVGRQKLAAYYLGGDCELPHDVATEKNLFGLGIKYDPEPISTMIANAPPGEKKDHAILHLVFRSAQDDPERARQWQQIIQDPGIKASAEKFLQKGK